MFTSLLLVAQNCPKVNTKKSYKVVKYICKQNTEVAAGLKFLISNRSLSIIQAIL